MAGESLGLPDAASLTCSSVKDTAVRRFFTKLALRTTARFYCKQRSCRCITSRKIVKRGPYVDLTEAASIQFIAERTSIPVPKVHCAFTSNDRTYIVMERLPGKPILPALETMDEASQDCVLKQLKSYLDEMRALTPPHRRAVQSCASSSLYDSRIPPGTRRFGPFATIQDFHRWLRDGFDVSGLQSSDCRAELEQMAYFQDSYWPPPVFTHGDLDPSNILVHEGHISGIIDWEFAGWYPHYWEYTCASYGNLIGPTNWTPFVDRILTPCPEELRMETTRQKWWGEL